VPVEVSAARTHGNLVRLIVRDTTARAGGRGARPARGAGAPDKRVPEELTAKPTIHFVGKPFDMTGLFEAARVLLGRRRATAPRPGARPR